MQKNKLEQKVRIGIVARVDNGGLGIMTLDFFKNFFVEKVLTITASYQNDYQRYEGWEGTEQIICQRGAPTLEEIDRFLEGLDLVVTFETPYNWNIYKRAREKGVKTILIPMYEWTEEVLPEMPDLLLCPSDLDYEVLSEPKKLVHTPINTKLINFKERTQAKTFVFQNGHGGFMGRNSMQEFLNAIPFVKSDVKFIVRSQVDFTPLEDPRVTYQHGEQDYNTMWDEGDIYIHLHKFDGLSLPLNEAMAAGFPIIALDLPPMNKFLNKELLVKPEGISKVKIYRNVDFATFSPVKVAEMIDKVASMSSEQIKALSQESKANADKWSWDNQKPKFLDVFHELCNK